MVVRAGEKVQSTRSGTRSIGFNLIRDGNESNDFVFLVYGRAARIRDVDRIEPNRRSPPSLVRLFICTQVAAPASPSHRFFCSQSKSPAVYRTIAAILRPVCCPSPLRIVRLEMLLVRAEKTA